MSGSLWDEVPGEIAAALEALRFNAKSAPGGLAALSPSQCERLLQWCDRNQLTLHLARAAMLPERLSEEAERRAGSNLKRLERLREAYGEIAEALGSAGADFLVLKGFTQWERYVAEPELRVQYDFDLYCPAESLEGARRALESIGYQALREMEEFPTDHLPVMVRKTGWEWRGDYFDPDIPFSVDVHFRFWDERTEGLAAPGTEAFWGRRTTVSIPGTGEVPTLAPADGLAYASLHLLRHLLRSSVRPAHVYELAWFLHYNGGDEELWDAWQRLHPPRLRVLQAICFRLAEDWFGCGLPAAARREVDALPACVGDWFASFSASPVAGQFHPRKDELWLHLSLVETAGQKAAVAARRLFPARWPGPVDAVLIPKERMTARLRWRSRGRYAAYVLSRAAHHTRALTPTLWRGWQWKTRSWGLRGGYWIFLASAFLFNLGVFAIVLLYNLYLVDIGFREDAIGRIAAAHTAGSVAGILPSAWVMGRLGVRNTMGLCFAGVAAMSALRATLTAEPALVACAALGGFALSIWPVVLSPAITQLTTGKTRALGFSLFFATGIGTGVLGGLLGGKLPGWLHDSKQQALYAGCGLAALALLPLGKLALEGPARAVKTVWPRERFVPRFLCALAVWNLATGAFNPFFNTFFARHGTPVERIGVIYSTGQMAQVAALLLSPLVLRRFGTLPGIAMMQAATGAALACLAWLPPGAGPAVYAAFMACQYMSEPGMYALLMERVAPEARGGASALNALVIFAVQALAAVGAGLAFARFGYPPVLTAAAGIAVAAGLAFRALPGRDVESDGVEVR